MYINGGGLIEGINYRILHEAPLNRVRGVHSGVYQRFGAKKSIYNEPPMDLLKKPIFLNWGIGDLNLSYLFRASRGIIWSQIELYDRYW